ncbi:MAG: UDP-N-acetylmuramoyl-L-alanine--D-glutamate ligase [Rhodospirillales bacterium]|nr:UDP-N-acetylmuramoyl-L-alanine--D-glutamate ligase [Rhodospirillales bacterium]
MINLFPFSGYPVAVLGLGKSGLVAAQALQKSGAKVQAWDDDDARRRAAGAAGVPVADLAAIDWRDITTLVISPGIPHTHPAPHKVAALAKQHNVEIIGDIELLARAQIDAGYVGVTGTNGKSTTTALLGHVLRGAGRDVQVGGNIGTPALALASLGEGGVYVLEMSSYQLEITISITFDVAILLNVTPDHLDRHGGMDGYVAAKRRIFHRQTRPRAAVIGVDDDICRRIHDDLVRADDQIVIPISAGRRLERGVYVVDGELFDAIDGRATRAIDLRPVATLPGAHNWQNAAAAYAAARVLGVAPDAIAAAMASYPGLPHRQEIVARAGGVAFVNDSKATNADATAKALACYDAIYWIAGGRAKEGGIASLAPFFPRIRRAYLIGEAAAAFAATLDGCVPYTRSGDLARATAAAHADAVREDTPGAVVLLSPACASFDQFANFEARGDAFRALALALDGAAPAARPGVAGGSA